MSTDDTSVSLSYTEVHHLVRVSVPTDAPPMDMDGDWQIQPQWATITYSIRTQTGLGWTPKVEVSGPWVQRDDRPDRPGYGTLLPWSEAHRPPWLTEKIQAHWPEWTPELPEAIHR